MRKFILAILVVIPLFFGISAYADSEKIKNPENRHQYQRFDTTMLWHTAKVFCEDLGGYLATITSEQEDAFVWENLASSSPASQFSWLGATDEGTEGTWRWVTDEPWDYTYWWPGVPDNCSGIEHYLHYFTSVLPGREGYWNDLGTLNDGGCGCGCPNEWYSMSTICEWDPEPMWSTASHIQSPSSKSPAAFESRQRFNNLTALFCITVGFVFTLRLLHWRKK